MTFELENFDWKMQTILLKQLLEKYSIDEMFFAINYYHNKGIDIYSLGYFRYGMRKALMAMKAEQDIENQVGDANERNRNKLRANNETLDREKYYLDLFEKSNEDN